jgi:gliding motility-associated peptidyl-prolyl isomerase
MQSSNYTPFLLLLILLALSSCEGPEPRRPITASTGSFFKESVERNKKILAEEEALIKKLIAQDSASTYQRSEYGFWYYYIIKKDNDSIQAKTGDTATLEYNLANLNGDEIYSKETIGVISYKVDKEDIIEGLRNGIKLMKKGETVGFIFPSALAYGYHGDNKKITTNTPLVSTVHLIDIKNNEP